MASGDTKISLGNHETQSESKEHDYAHASQNSSAAPPPPCTGTTASHGTRPAQATGSLSVELPDPSVGAEVDCPGVNEEETDRHDATSPSALRTQGDFRPAPRGRRAFKRPEDKDCCCCKTPFERHGRSFNRRAVYTFTTPETVHWAFPGSVTHNKSFLCETCAQVIRTKCKRKNTGKRSLWLKPPAPKQSDSRDKNKKGGRMGKKSKAALLVSKSCYKAAFKMLWSAKGARKPMMEFLSKQLKEEMKVLSRQADSPFHQKVSSKKPLTSFPWGGCLSWAQDHAPLVTTCLRSLFPTVKALVKSSHQLTEEQAQMLLERRTMLTLSVPLFTRNIWKNNFMQAALGAALRLQGCSSSALDTLNTLGLCQNKDTVRLRLHRLQSCEDASTENGQQGIKIKPEHSKGEDMMDMEGDDEEEDDEDEEEEEVAENDDEDDEDVEEDEEEETQEEDDEEEDRVAEEKAELEKKRRRKAAKKQRKEEKKRERGKRKAKEQEEELEEDDEGPEEKKRRVVVVRLDLLKGHSEVGRSDLSAP